MDITTAIPRERLGGFPFFDNFSTGITINTTDYDYEAFDQLCDAQARYRLFENIIHIGVVGFLILFGCIGNTLAIIVLRSDRSNKTVNFLLLALAVADNMYLLASLFLQTLRSLSTSTDWLPNYAYVEQYSWPFAAIAQTTTVWIVVLVTADRYIAICHPFKVPCLCTLARAKCVVLGIVIVAVLYNIPRFFEQQVDLVQDLCSQKWIYVTRQTALWKNRTYFIVYKTCMYFIFRLFFPLITLFVLNTRLIMVLKTANKSRASLTNTVPKKQPKKDSVTFVLVIVVTVFLLCELPDAILRLFWTASKIGSFRPDRTKLNYANTVSNMFLTVNSSVNCLIYTITGATFRKRLARLLPWRRRKAPASHVPYYYHCSEERHNGGGGLLNKLAPGVALLGGGVGAGRGYHGATGALCHEVNTSSSVLKETGM